MQSTYKIICFSLFLALNALAYSEALCDYPLSIRNAVELQLGKTCSSISNQEAQSVKKLKITGIPSEAEWLGTQSFPLLEGVEELDLSNNDIYFLPFFVLGFSKLKSLNVSYTRISSFDESICSLKTLKVLKASHNFYENNEIPFHVFCLTGLEVMDFSDSRIQYIDEYIYHLQNLKELYMGRNQLVNVPALLHLLPLEIVDFSFNAFESKSFWKALVQIEKADHLSIALNSRHDCSQADDKEKCMENISTTYQCAWWSRENLDRGQPLRRFTKMTDREFEQFKKSRPARRSSHYSYWLHLLGSQIAEDSHIKEEYLKRTINSKTIREWRLIDSVHPLFSYNKIVPFAKTVWNYFECNSTISSYATSYLPNTAEYLAEQYVVQDPKKLKEWQDDMREEYKNNKDKPKYPDWQRNFIHLHNLQPDKSQQDTGSK